MLGGLAQIPESGAPPVIKASAAGATTLPARSTTSASFRTAGRHVHRRDSRTTVSPVRGLRDDLQLDAIEYVRITEDPDEDYLQMIGTLISAASAVHAADSGDNTIELWGLYNKLLEDHEPTMRFLGLRALLSACPVLCSRSTIATSLIDEMVYLLTDVFIADEAAGNRMLAAEVIGRLCSVASVGTASEVQHTVYRRMEKELRRVFIGIEEEGCNPDSEAEARRRAEANQQRISVMSALVGFVDAPIDDDDDDDDDGDDIADGGLGGGTDVSVAVPTVHTTCEAEEAANNADVVTKPGLRGAALLDYTLSAVLRLSDDPMLVANTLRLMRQMKQTGGNRRRIAPLMPLVREWTNKARHDIVTLELSRFLAKWYPRPTDRVLQSFPTPEFLTGYAKRRYEFLQMHDIGSDVQDASVSGGRSGRALVATLATNMVKSSLASTENELRVEDLVAVTIDLSFHIGRSGVYLDATQPCREVHLTNRSSTQDHDFTLQVYPSDMFTAVPAFGTVTAASSLPIMITFIPQAQRNAETPRIQGFLRIRSSIGLPLERVALYAYNGPLLRLYARTVRCGWCPRGMTVSATILVRCTAAAAVTCVVHNRSDSPVFRVSPPQCSLRAGQSVLFTVTFAPRDKGSFTEVVDFSAASESHSVTLTGECGEAIRSESYTLDFGPTDMYCTSAYERTIDLTNHEKHALPVYISSACPDIKTQDVVIGAGETRSVKVSYAPTNPGPVREKLLIVAPRTRPILMDVNSFVGALLTLPLCRHAFLQPVYLHGETSLRLPMLNTSPFSVELRISHTDDDQFAYRIVDGAGRAMQTQRYNVGAIIYHTTSVPADSHVLIIATFTGKRAGLFRTPLHVSIVRPQNTTLDPYILYAVAYPETGRRSPFDADMLRGFLTRNAEPKENVRVTNTGSTLVKPLPCPFKFEQNQSFVFHDGKEIRSEAIVQVTNKTNEKRDYFVMLSWPFHVFSVPTAGTLGPHETIDLPVHLSPQVSASELYGGIVMITDKACTVCASIPIYGTTTAVVHAHLPGPTIDLTECNVGDRVSRRILLESRSPEPVRWHAELDRSQFSFHKSKGILPPYGRELIEVSFRSDVKGNFSSKMRVWHSDVREHAASIRNAEISRTARAAAAREEARRKRREAKKARLEAQQAALLAQQEQARQEMQQQEDGAEGARRRSSSTGSWQDVMEDVMDQMLSASSSSNGSRSSSSNDGSSRRIDGDGGAGDGDDDDDDDDDDDYDEAESAPVSLTLEMLEHDELSWIQVAATAVTVRVGGPEVSIEPKYLDFGSTDINSSDSLSLTLTNPTFHSGRIFGVVTSPFQLQESSLQLLAQRSLDVGVTYRPLTQGQHADFLHLYNRDRLYSVPLLGYGGTTNLVSNMGPPNGGDEEMAIDIGVTSTRDPLARKFQLSNVGSLPITVVQVEVIGDTLSLFPWESTSVADYVPAADDLSSVERLDQEEIDYDEIEYQRQRSSGSGKATSSEPKGSDPQPGGRALLHGSGGSIVGAASPLPLPALLLPGQSLKMSMAFTAAEKGEYYPALRVWCLLNGQEEAVPKFVFRFRGSVQPQLDLSTHEMKFGVVEVQTSKSQKLLFSNLGEYPSTWSIQIRRPRSLNPNASTSHQYLRSPFQVFPREGRLQPGRFQTIEVTFAPFAVQESVDTIMTISSDNQGRANVKLSGTGGSTVPHVDTHEVDFKCVRVGGSDTRTVVLSNNGYLDSRFYVENTNMQYAISPDRGMLRGMTKVELSITFQPTAVRGYPGVLLAYLTRAPKASRLSIQLKGSGGHPNLEVRSNVVDFGVSLLNHANRAHVRLYNKGSASGRCELVLPSRWSLRQEPAGELVVPAHSHLDATLVMVPTEMGQLEDEFIVAILDRPHNRIRLKLKALVGAPNIVFDPPNALENINFGVSMLRQTQTRTFRMINTGSIDLDYEFFFVRHIDDITDDSESDSGSIAIASKQRPATSETAERTVTLAGQNMQQYEPPELKVLPESGLLRIGQPVLVTLTYTPQEFQEITKCFVVMKNVFQTLTGAIVGVGGEAIMELDSPLRILDFGVCRMGQDFERALVVNNAGNIEFQYRTRPEPADGNWDTYLTPEGMAVVKKGSPPAPWMEELDRVGLSIRHPDGTCLPAQRRNIRVRFTPRSQEMVLTKLRIFYGSGSETVIVKGSGGNAHLRIDGPNGTALPRMAGLPAVFDFGLRPSNATHNAMLTLVNDGDFDTEFFIPPHLPEEFEITPMTGLIRSGDSAPIELHFKPRVETTKTVTATAKLIWDGSPIDFAIRGTGGTGRLTAEYLSSGDRDMAGLDFDVIATRCPVVKRWRLHNRGHFGTHFRITSNAPFFVALNFADTMMGVHARDPIVYMREVPSFISNQLTSVEGYLAPNTNVIVVVGIYVQEPVLYSGLIDVQGEFGSFSIPVRATGCAVSLEHEGSLAFGNVASDYTYSRKITILNTGGLALAISMDWAIVGLADAAQASITPGVVSLREFTRRQSAAQTRWSSAVKLVQRHVQQPKRREVARRSWSMLRQVILRQQPRMAGVADEVLDEMSVRDACSDGYSAAVERSNAGWSIMHDVEQGSVGSTRSRKILTRQVSNASMLPATGGVDDNDSVGPPRRSASDVSVEAVRLVVPSARGGSPTRSSGGVSMFDYTEEDDEDEQLSRVRLLQRGKRKFIDDDARSARSARSGEAMSSSAASNSKITALRRELAHSESKNHLTAIMNVANKRSDLDLDVDAISSASGAVGDTADGDSAMMQNVGGRFAGRMRSATYAVEQQRYAASGNLLGLAPSKRAAALLTKVYGQDIQASEFNRERPHVAVTPVIATVPKYSRVDLTVNLRVSAGTTANIMGTLVIRPNLFGVAPHEIPLTATPRKIAVVCDDMTPIDFGRIPIGNAVTAKREFSNVGEVDVRFTVQSANKGLTISPLSGVLKQRKSLTVVFTFRPMSQVMQTAPILLVSEVDSLHLVELPFAGGGGTCTLSLPSFERFDFGRCMAARTTIKSLPLRNTGDAPLLVKQVILEGNSVFATATGWPDRSFHIQPMAVFDLPIAFTPPGENPPLGRLTIVTQMKTYNLDLTGTGRHSMLIPSRMDLSFIGCIVGLSYYETIEFTNVGEVMYPLEFLVSDDAGDQLQTMPRSVTIPPFEKTQMTVHFHPTATTDCTYHVHAKSPYSDHVIPVVARAGQPRMVIEPDLVQFGLFESPINGNRGPARTVTIRNTGNMHLQLHIRADKLTTTGIGGAEDNDSGRSEVKESSGARGEAKAKTLAPPGSASARQLVRSRSRSSGSGMTRARSTSGIGAGSKQVLRFSATSLTVMPGESADVTIQYMRARVPDGAFQVLVPIDTNYLKIPTTMMVSGECSQAVLNTEQLKNITFGTCVVGSTAATSICMRNDGRFPLTYTLKPTYPVKIAEPSGQVPPGDTVEVRATWHATSTHALRSYVKVTWNQGRTHEFMIKGLSYNPEVSVTPCRIDFGVAVTHQVTQRPLMIRNTGKVPARWSIPSLRQGFSASSTVGTLGVGESVQITVYFKPTAVGLVYRGSFVVETRGRHIDVVMAGVGGTMQIRVPTAVRIGTLPFGQWYAHRVSVSNVGDVSADLKLSVSHINQDAGICSSIGSASSNGSSRRSSNSSSSSSGSGSSHGDGRDGTLGEAASEDGSTTETCLGEHDLQLAVVPRRIIVHPRGKAVVHVWMKPKATGKVHARVLAQPVIGPGNEASPMLEWETRMIGRAEKIVLSDELASALATNTVAATRMPHPLQADPLVLPQGQAEAVKADATTDLVVYEVLRCEPRVRESGALLRRLTRMPTPVIVTPPLQRLLQRPACFVQDDAHRVPLEQMDVYAYSYRLV